MLTAISFEAFKRDLREMQELRGRIQRNGRVRHELSLAPRAVLMLDAKHDRREYLPETDLIWKNETI